MSDDEPPSGPISALAYPIVDIDVVCAAWRDDLPDASDVCREAAVAAIAAAGLASLSFRLEVGVRLTDAAEIQRLNRIHRGRDAPTNVLAFPAIDCVPGAPPPPPPAGLPLALGDVVVAHETVRAEAIAQGKSLPHHVRHLVVHGILHLAGYDHKMADDAAAMEGLEIAALTGLGVPDPYSPGALRRRHTNPTHEQP